MTLWHFQISIVVPRHILSASDILGNFECFALGCFSRFSVFCALIGSFSFFGFSRSLIGQFLSSVGANFSLEHQFRDRKIRIFAQFKNFNFWDYFRTQEFWVIVFWSFSDYFCIITITHLRFRSRIWYCTSFATRSPWSFWEMLDSYLRIPPHLCLFWILFWVL